MTHFISKKIDLSRMISHYEESDINIIIQTYILILSGFMIVYVEHNKNNSHRTTYDIVVNICRCKDLSQLSMS